METALSLTQSSGMLTNGIMRSSTAGPVRGRRDGSFGSRYRLWLVHEQSVCSLESGLLIGDRMTCLGARLEGVGSLGSGLHRERKWIQLVRGRRYHRDTGWARLKSSEGWLIPEQGVCSLRRGWELIPEQGVCLLRRGWGLVHEPEGTLVWERMVSTLSMTFEACVSEEVATRSMLSLCLRLQQLL